MQKFDIKMDMETLIVGKEVNPNPKRRLSDIGDDENSKKMMPSVFVQCHPISTLEDLDGVIQEPPEWIKRVQMLKPRSPTVVQNILSDCHSDSKHFLPRSRIDGRIIPKTLVCHDYKGGYQSDKYLHYPGEDILGNGYTFYNWAQIDIFVYFSHHFITIPPLCWINAGHSNGVKVLGTLITEFGPGSELCDNRIFKNTEVMRDFAKSLAEITKIFKFDGWLLNIENNVKNVDILKEFVPYLTNLIHEDNPGSLVIWYDSVTEKGDLNWQNELNKHNRYFFDSCDGIFLNYTWSEKHLINTVEEASHRNLDVFVGIDVFGRNMFGGGKFNTFKAAEMVTRYGLSMAIFAPGWTHETLQKDDKFFEQFLNIDSAFWSSLWPYMYTHPIRTYFSTNFYIGLDKSCYNIFSQHHQLSKFLHPKKLIAIPDYEKIPTLNNKCGCIQGEIFGSRNTCFLTRENLRKDIEYVHHLFVCDLEIINNTVVYFLTKSTDPDDSSKLSITILLSGYNGSLRKIRLLSKRSDNPLDNASVLEVNPSDSPDVIDRIKNKYRRRIVDEDWRLSVYIFATGSCKILEVGGTIENGSSLLLSVFGIENADGNFLKND